MPKPILCLSEPLRQFADAFRPCFSPRQWQYFVIVLLGLVECKERRTLSGLKRTVADGVSVSGLSRFLSRWRWSAESAATTWLTRFRQQMVAPVQAEHAHLRAERVHRRGRPKTTGVQVTSASTTRCPSSLKVARWAGWDTTTPRRRSDRSVDTGAHPRCVPPTSRRAPAGGQPDMVAQL